MKVENSRSLEKSCVIVGAGMAGLTAGRTLQARGWEVTLLDKGRGFGGRMATRSVGSGRFDYGAQFFTARDVRFGEAIRRWESAGWVAPWFTQDGFEHETHTRYRAEGGMSALAGHLAEGLDVRRASRVGSVEPSGAGWNVMADSGEVFRAGVLLLTPPAPQTAELLAGIATRLQPDVIPVLNSIVFDPCYALLAALDGPGRVPFPGYIRPTSGPIEWIADNTAKGVSRGNAALTIHARADFSARYFDSPRDEVAAILLESAAPWMGGPATEWHLHRWKYSKPTTGDLPLCLFSRQPAPLAIAGDAFGGSRVEGAFLSGLAAAGIFAEGF